MNGLVYCEKHNQRWIDGDGVCTQCCSEEMKRNHFMNGIRVKKTKAGKVWPVKGDENYGK